MLALLVEVLLILIVLTLGTAIVPHEEKRETMTSVTFRSPPEAKKAEEQEESKAPVVQPEEREPKPKAEPEPREVQPIVPPALPPPVAVIPVSPRTVPAAPPAEAPRAPGPPAPAPAKRSPMGPVDSGGAAAYADTARVGTAPGGQPLYAAAWYREPSNSELAGYLSTASGPGWGLIACRTAPDFRVEDCVPLDEYPAGSQINRAILAATWQFQVRPPRVGGTPKIGAWVRIRIDYGIRRRQGS